MFHFIQIHLFKGVLHDFGGTAFFIVFPKLIFQLQSTMISVGMVELGQTSQSESSFFPVINIPINLPSK